MAMIPMECDSLGPLLANERVTASSSISSDTVAISSNGICLKIDSFSLSQQSKTTDVTYNTRYYVALAKFSDSDIKKVYKGKTDTTAITGIPETSVVGSTISLGSMLLVYSNSVWNLIDTRIRQNSSGSMSIAAQTIYPQTTMNAYAASAV